MPNWKKVIVSGSDASLNSVSGSVLLTGDLNANSNNIISVAKVGAATNDEYLDFGTDAMIKVAIDDVEDFRFADGGTFHANADVVAYSSTVSSDERLKTNIIDTKYGLDHILGLEAKEFDWKEKLNGRHDIGFIAQQVQEVVPILVNAIKELKNEIDELKNN